MGPKLDHVEAKLVETPTSSESAVELFNLVTKILRPSIPAGRRSPLLVYEGGPRTRRELQQRLSGRNLVHPREGGGPPAFIVPTSGSTGEPSLVVLGKTAVLNAAHATHQALGGEGRWVAALPFQHVAGLMVLARSAAAGVSPAFALGSKSFSVQHFSRVVATAREESQHQRLYTALVSKQLAEALNDDRGIEALRSFDAILLGGGRIAPSLLETASAAGVEVVTTYGMTETCGGCVYDGLPLADTKIRIKSPSSEGVGQILLSTPALMTGYLGESPSWVELDGVQWLATSDLGCVNTDGRLEVRGRADDIVNSGGKKISTAAVQDALVGAAHVASSYVFGIPDPDWGEVIAVAVVRHPNDSSSGLEPLAELLRDTVGATLGRHAAPRVVFEVETLPVTSLGKVSKPEVVALLEQAISQGRAWQR